MIKIAGDLYNRVLLNKKRLSDDLYTYKEVFDHTSDWPGDFVGRAILALVSLHRALDGFDVEQINIENQLKDIFDHINTRLNEDGYFGPKFDDTFVDEQQISGNSWFLRGLIEYYKLTKNDKYLKQINTICDKYLLKIAKGLASFFNVASTSKSNAKSVPLFMDCSIYSFSCCCFSQAILDAFLASSKFFCSCSTRLRSSSSSNSSSFLSSSAS